LSASKESYSYVPYESPSGSADDEEEESSDSFSGPPTVPTTVCGHYRVIDMIGSGSYSDVYSGVDQVTSEKVAIKFEWTRAEKGRRLLDEAKLYKSLGRTNNTPNIRWSGTEAEYNIMVMDLLGPSLDSLFIACGRKFTLKTVLMLAEQMISLIQFVHSRDIVHRDIKPHNFLMGLGEDSHRVVIMDFGLAKRFRDADTGKHIPCTQGRGVTGTVRYASINVHRGLEPSRRDDLEAIGYVLMHFMRRTLPWQGLKASSKRAKHEKIKRCKQKTSDEELCDGYPYEFVQFFKHCRSLQYEDKPDYDYLRRLMRGLFKRERFQDDNRFDWMNGHDANKFARCAEPRRRSRSRENRPDRPNSRSRKSYRKQGASFSKDKAKRKSKERFTNEDLNADSRHGDRKVRQDLCGTM